MNPNNWSPYGNNEKHILDAVSMGMTGVLMR